MSARLPYVEDPPPAVAAVYEELKKTMGRVLNYVGPELVEELTKRLTPQQVVQLTLSIAAANFTTRFNQALGTELEVRH